MRRHDCRRFRLSGPLLFLLSVQPLQRNQEPTSDPRSGESDSRPYRQHAALAGHIPNGRAPVVRVAPDGARELTMMRWGFPPPAIPDSKPRNPYLTNIRNTDSRYWRPFLKHTGSRSLVPVTSFAEPDNNQGPRSIWTWFAQDETRPLMFFAGIWREWGGDRGTKAIPDVGTHTVFSFLTTDASPDVAPIHPDATPVLLLDEAAREQWMKAPMEEALLLQRPPPAGAFKIVGAGEKQDVG